MYTKKDFRLEWFSGTGAGGQHRNKHQNCCRITHIQSGLRTIGQNHRSREANLKDAFTRLAAKLLARDQRFETRRSNSEVVRTYNLERDEVIDNATHIRSDANSVLDGDLDQFLLSLDRENERPHTGRA